jgi:hypothetical protein
MQPPKRVYQSTEWNHPDTWSDPKINPPDTQFPFDPNEQRTASVITMLSLKAKKKKTSRMRKSSQPEVRDNFCIEDRPNVKLAIARRNPGAPAAADPDPEKDVPKSAAGKMQDEETMCLGA